MPRELLAENTDNSKKYFTMHVKSLKVIKDFKDYDPNYKGEYEVTLEDTVENRNFARMLGSICLQKEIIQSVNFY